MNAPDGSVVIIDRKVEAKNRWILLFFCYYEAKMTHLPCQNRSTEHPSSGRYHFHRDLSSSGGLALIND